MALDPNLQNQDTVTAPVRQSAQGAIETASLVSSFDVLKTEELNTLFLRKGMQGISFMMLLRSIGFDLPVAQGQYGHFEEDYTYQTFRTNGYAGGAVGTAFIVTVMNGTGGDVSATGGVFVRNGDEILLPDLKTQLRVQGIAFSGSTGTINATVTITFVPKNLTATVPAIAAGQELAISSSSFGEGTSQPTSVVNGVLQYANFTQIIKEAMSTTGTSMTNMLRFIKDSNGKGIPAYWVKGQDDTDYRYAKKASGALLFGQLTTNPLILDTTPALGTGTGLNTEGIEGGQFNTTEGLIPYIQRTGHILPYSAGGWTVSKFDDISKILEKERAGNRVLCLWGFDLLVNNENVLYSYFKNTMTSYKQEALDMQIFGGLKEGYATSDESRGIVGGAKGLAMSVKFDYFEKAGRTFCFHKMGEFDDPETYGAAGYSTPGLGVIVPFDTKKNKMTQEDVPSIGSRYKKLGNYDRRMQVWNQAGAGTGLLTQPADVYKYFLRGDIGFHGIGGNRMILLQQV